MGEEEGKAFFQAIADRGVQIVDGNSVTKDMAAAEQVKIGFTDTDDAKDAIGDRAPVEMVFPVIASGALFAFCDRFLCSFPVPVPDLHSRSFSEYSRGRSLYQIGFLALLMIFWVRRVIWRTF